MITTEELARIRTAAVGDMLGDSKELDKLGPAATIFRLCRELELATKRAVAMSEVAAAAWGGEIPSPLPGHTHMTEELTLLPCPLCQATAHVEYHNGYLRVICEGEPGCPFRMGGKRFVFPDECSDWWNNLPRALEWTDEPPKVPGWYWFKTAYRTHIVSVEPDPRKVDDLYICVGSVGNWMSKLHGQWAGPIPEPREPK